MIWHTLRQGIPSFWKIAFRHIRSVLMDPLGRGIEIVISGQRVRVPAYFRGGGRADYETIATARFVRWIGEHPQATVIDCGCSLSTYGLIALNRSSTVRVIGIDPDLVSLKCTRNLCAKSPGFPDGLHVVHGFLGVDHLSSATLATAAALTQRQIDDPSVPGIIEATGYREATDAQFSTVPRHSLDGLTQLEAAPASYLLKIDVEGFELQVLRGATDFLARCRPTILLSARPQFFARLGTSTEELVEFLRAHRYRYSLLATDHEEHWWCEPM